MDDSLTSHVLREQTTADHPPRAVSVSSLYYQLYGKYARQLYNNFSLSTRTIRQSMGP